MGEERICAISSGYFWIQELFYSYPPHPEKAPGTIIQKVTCWWPYFYLRT